MPRRAIEALESEVRALSERVGHSRQAGAEGPSLAVLEQELAEVRDALRGLTPAESLVGFEDAVRALSQKIDMIAESAQAPGGDPRAFKQLEQAVTSLRGVVSNVASDGALAQLSAEVHGLATQFERAAAESSSEALTRLEARIAAVMESGRAVPPELEGSIRELSERLDRAQLSQGDQLALGALEDRIAKLSEKLDASDARLNQLDAVERGLADLLVHLEEMKNGGSRTLRAAPPAEPAPEPAVPQRPAPVAPAQAPVHAPVHAPAPAASSPLDLIPEMVVEPQPAPQSQQYGTAARVGRACAARPARRAACGSRIHAAGRAAAEAARQGHAGRACAPADRSEPAARHAARARQRRAARAARLGRGPHRRVRSGAERLPAFGRRSRQQVGGDCRRPQCRQVRLSRHPGEGAEAAIARRRAAASGRSRKRSPRANRNSRAAGADAAGDARRADAATDPATDAATDTGIDAACPQATT